MNRSSRFFLSIMLFGLLTAPVWPQVSTLAEIKYKEDYDRLQSIRRTQDVAKRAGQFLNLYRDRLDMDPKLLAYADNLFAKDLETLTQQQDYKSLKGICEGTLKIRPRFGEVYLFEGVVLKNEGKIDEAMSAFARCYLIKNPFQAKAKQLLDIAYRAKNKGSLAGEEKIIKQAAQELK